MKRIMKAAELVLSLILVIGTVSGCGRSGGDGKSSCKNCGRKEVYALGYCHTCYDGFIEFTYKND